MDGAVNIFGVTGKLVVPPATPQERIQLYLQPYGGIKPTLRGGGDSMLEEGINVALPQFSSPQTMSSFHLLPHPSLHFASIPRRRRAEGGGGAVPRKFGAPVWGDGCPRPVLAPEFAHAILARFSPAGASQEKQDRLQHVPAEVKECGWCRPGHHTVSLAPMSKSRRSLLKACATPLASAAWPRRATHTVLSASPTGRMGVASVLL